MFSKMGEGGRCPPFSPKDGKPAYGWGAGVDARYLGSVAVNDVNIDAAAAFVTPGAHVGYVLALDRWHIAATARIDNLTDRKYAGSVIVNEGNGRYFEPAAGRNYVLPLAASLPLLGAARAQ